MKIITLAAQLIYKEDYSNIKWRKSKFYKETSPVELIYFEKFQRIDGAFSREK